MKRTLQMLLIVIIIGLSVGFYYIDQDNVLGKKVVGISVLAFALVLLPLFLYHRYKGKKMTDYMLDNDKINEIFDNLKM